MALRSILFARPESRPAEDVSDYPPFFRDLGLDQIVHAVITGRESYCLAPFFAAPLRDVDAIYYRQEVFRDLERAETWECVNAFARAMRAMRENLAQAEKLHHHYQKERWFLDAVSIYIDAVTSLLQGLSAVDLRSRGLITFRDDLWAYIRSSAFTDLVSDRNHVISALNQVIYCLDIHNQHIIVRRYAEEADYASEIADIFAKFSQYANNDYLVTFREGMAMNHVEEGILDRVALLYPDVFTALDTFYERHRSYLDEGIAAFDRELQFYLAYLDYTRRLQAAGLPFCYPVVSAHSREVYARETYDLALAFKLLHRGAVVCNDFSLRDPERIIVVSGPNQGGKTTFARAFGQLHYLASLGCPVPGREARLLLFDELFTHFEREEKAGSLRGKLEDDLFRIHDILARATSRSIIIMNEIFTSATLQDEIFLSTKVMTKLIELGLLCVWVTFVDELASFGPQTVSMVSTVVPEDPALRTFKILRRPADGLAYAMAIARKYRLTYECIKERIKT